MKCANHPEADAAAACVNCGKLVCSECRTMIAGRNYCKSCVGEMIAGGPAAAKRTAKPVIGGILGIIAGLAGLGFGSFLFNPGGFGLFFDAVAVVAIVGSSFAIARKNYGLALAGGICAVISGGILLGVIALVLIVTSRDEFSDSR